MSIFSPIATGQCCPPEPLQRKSLLVQKDGQIVVSSRRYARSVLPVRLAAGFVHAAIFLSIVIASFPVAEFVFRLIGDEPSSDLRGLYAPFANRNYKLAAEVQTSARLASGPLTVYTDTFGLRCDKALRFGAHRDKPINILLTGDSQGFGNGVNFEDTIAGSIAALAAEQGYRVSNASVGGHSLANQLQVARWLTEEQGLTIENFVLLLTPVMIHSPDEPNQVTVGDDGRLYAEPTIGAHVRGWAKRNSVVYSRLRDSVRNLGIGANPIQGSSTVFSLYDANYQQATMEEALLATMTKFRDFAAIHGAGIQVVYVPLTIEATFESARQAAARQNISLDPDLPYRIAASVAARLGIPMHDLRPVLQQAHSVGQVLTVKGDFHYSPSLSRACGARLWTEFALPAGKLNVIGANRSN